MGEYFSSAERVTFALMVLVGLFLSYEIFLAVMRIDGTLALKSR